MIAFALIAIGIVWVVISNILDKNQEDIEAGLSNVELDIVDSSVVIAAEGVSFQLKRDIGKGDLVKVKFVFVGDGKTEVLERNMTTGELDRKSFSFDVSDFEKIETIEKISVAPIIRLESGRESLRDIADIYIITGNENDDFVEIEEEEIEDGCTEDDDCSNGEICYEGDCIGGATTQPNNLILDLSFDSDVSQASSPQHNLVDESTVGLWQFENNANDESYYDNDGIIADHKPTYISSGKVGGAYSFDGINDYIDMGSPEDGSLNCAGEFTIGFWIKADKINSMIATGNHIISKRWYDDGYSIDMNSWDYKISFDIKRGAGFYKAVGSANILDNSWHHVVFVKDSTLWKSYSDGENEIIGKGESIWTSDTRFVIGAHSSLDSYFKGLLDEVQIYNRTLTSSEINEWYVRNGGGNSVTPDSSAYDNEGEVYGSEWISDGHNNGAYSFDGINDYVNSDVEFSRSEVSISFWALVNEVKQQSVFVANPDNTDDRINLHLCYIDGNTYWDFGDISNDGRLSDVNPDSCLDGLWHHYVATASKSKDNMEIYIDGDLWINKSGMNSLNDISQLISIGGKENYYFNGLIDDFKIYNVSLSEDSIEDLFQNN